MNTFCSFVCVWLSTTKIIEIFRVYYVFMYVCRQNAKCEKAMANDGLVKSIAYMDAIRHQRTAHQTTNQPNICIQTTKFTSTQTKLSKQPHEKHRINKIKTKTHRTKSRNRERERDKTGHTKKRKRVYNENENTFGNTGHSHSKSKSLNQTNRFAVKQIHIHTHTASKEFLSLWQKYTEIHTHTQIQS